MVQQAREREIEREGERSEASHSQSFSMKGSFSWGWTSVNRGPTTLCSAERESWGLKLWDMLALQSHGGRDRVLLESRGGRVNVVWESRGGRVRVARESCGEESGWKCDKTCPKSNIFLPTIGFHIKLGESICKTTLSSWQRPAHTQAYSHVQLPLHPSGHLTPNLIHTCPTLGK